MGLGMDGGMGVSVCLINIMSNMSSTHECRVLNMFTTEQGAYPGAGMCAGGMGVSISI